MNRSQPSFLKILISMSVEHEYTQSKIYLDNRVGPSSQNLAAYSFTSLASLFSSSCAMLSYALQWHPNSHQIVQKCGISYLHVSISQPQQTTTGYSCSSKHLACMTVCKHECTCKQELTCASTNASRHVRWITQTRGCVHTTPHICSYFRP